MLINTATLVSDCCYAPEKFDADWDSSSSDMGFCPECKDHCLFVNDTCDTCENLITECVCNRWMGTDPEED